MRYDLMAVSQACADCDEMSFRGDNTMIPQGLRRSGELVVVHPLQGVDLL